MARVERYRHTEGSESMAFEDLDHSSSSFHAHEIVGATCALNHMNLDPQNNRSFHRSKLHNSKFQQSCFEFGEIVLPTPVAASISTRMPEQGPMPTTMRRVKSSDHLDKAGIRPPRRSRSSEGEIERMSSTTASATHTSRRGRRQASRAKSLGSHDADILDKVVAGSKADPPVNKLSALQRPTVKRDLGPKREARRLGLAPPGTGDGIFKAKIKAPQDNQGESNGKRAPRAKSGGLLGLVKGRPAA
jgi:hypothetical protein